MAVAAITPSLAHAGGYDVKVCKDGYGNGGALTAYGTGSYDAYNIVRVTNNCDGGWNGWNGISVSVNNGLESPRSDVYVNQNTSANIYAAAPAGAGIRKIHVDNGRLANYYGNTTGWNARVMIPSLGWCRTDGEGGGWCNMGWQNPADNSWQTNWASPDYPGYSNRDIGPINGDVADIAIGVVCNGGGTWAERPCYRPQYKPAAGVAIASADIQVVDNTKPAISALGGQVANGAWNRPGAVGYSATGWDNTGIQTFEKYVDGGHVGNDDQPCDYSRMKPCEDRPVNSTVTVNGYDGFHTVLVRARSATQYWIDCNVDCADTYATVAIDGNAPGAPVAVNNGPAWANANAFNLNAPTPASENDPDGGGPQARSPIARRIVTICPANQQGSPSCVTKDASPVGGSNQPASAAITAPGEGAWEATVALADQVGNIGAQSNRVPVRLDLTPPTAAVSTGALEIKIELADALSGFVGSKASLKYRIDGAGEWKTVPGQQSTTVAAAAGRRYIEVQATDAAGNTMAQPQRFDVTVTDGTGSVVKPRPIGGDSQVSLADRGELNGTGASEAATLTAWFQTKPKKNAKTTSSKKALTVRTIGEKNKTTIEGLLVNTQGAGIGGARIDVIADIAGGRTDYKKGAATTDAEGNFTIQLGPGQTSRKLTISYPLRVNDTQPAAAAGLQLLVKARASFVVDPPKHGNTWTFRGFVSSGYLTKQGTRVEIRWKYARGGGWSTLKTVRTDSKGRWKYKRAFNARETYRMQAYVPSTPAYAYKGAASRIRTVQIR